MKKVIRLTESDLVRIVKRVLKENETKTLKDILRNKETLSHLKGMYVKVIDGTFTEKYPDYLGMGGVVLFWDARDGHVGVELTDGNSVRLYPDELVLNAERFNIR